METLADKIALLGRHVDRAVIGVGSDKGASPVLVAVVGEFAAKYKKGAAALSSGGNAREAVVEVEQAADSARVAAAADPGITADTRKLVTVAHDAICLIKFEDK